LKLSEILKLSADAFNSNRVSGYFIGSPANDHDCINICNMAASEMFSISLSVDGTIKLANSLQHIIPLTPLIHSTSHRGMSGSESHGSSA